MKVENIPNEYPLKLLRQIDWLARPLDQSVRIDDKVDEKKSDEALDKILFDQIEQNKKHIRPTFVKEPETPLTPKLEVSAESASSSENSPEESQYKSLRKRETPAHSPSPSTLLKSYLERAYLIKAEGKPLEKSAVSITPADILDYSPPSQTKIPHFENTQAVTPIPRDVIQRSRAHTPRPNKNPVNESESTSRSSCCNCLFRLFGQNTQPRKAQNHFSKNHIPNTGQLRQ
jgi:hypothetical protein